MFIAEGILLQFDISMVTDQNAHVSRPLLTHVVKTNTITRGLYSQKYLFTFNEITVI